MPEHVVRVSQPTRELVNSDVTFEIYSDAQKLGTLLVSKGTVDWFPRNAGRQRSVWSGKTWRYFSTLRSRTVRHS